jgi:hypothetical protein
MDIYHFLLHTPEGQKLIDIMPSSEDSLVKLFMGPVLQDRGYHWEDRCRSVYKHWQALIISLAMGYYFRLPATPGQFNRAGFVDNVNR